MRSAITRAWAGALPSAAKASREGDGAPIIFRRAETRGTDRSGWDEQAALAEGYESNPWVYTAITLKARAASSVPLIVQSRTKDGDWESAKDGGGELGRLIDRPSPEHDTAELLFSTMVQQDCTGNQLAKIQRRGNSDREDMPIIALWPLMAGYRPIRDRSGYASAYENQNLAANSEDRKIPAEQVVHWKYQNPRDHAWGLSPLKSIREVIAADNEAAVWNRESMQGRAAVDLILSAAFSGSTVDKDKYKWIRQLIDTELTGARNARRPAYLPGEIKAQQLDRSPVEMDFLNTGKFTVQKIAAPLGLLPALLSPEAATYSNLREAIIDLWDRTITGWVRDFCRVLGRRVVPAFGDPHLIRVMPDWGAVSALKDAMLKRVETMERLTRIGTPYNEAAALLELDLGPQPGGDVPHGLSLAAQIAALRLEGGAGALPVQVNARRTERRVKALPGPGAGKDAARRAVEPLSAQAARTADQVAKLYRELVAALVAGRQREAEALRAALLSGDNARLAIVAGLPQFGSGIVDAFGRPVGAGAEVGAAAGREALSRLIGRDLTLDTGLVARNAAEAVRAAAEFIRNSSERGLLAVVAMLRSLGLDESDLAKMAPLLPLFAAANAQQAGAIGGMARDLLKGGMAWDAIVGKVTRALEKAIPARALGIGSDLGTRSVFGGQRWAGEDALTSGEIRTLLRMWVDSDDGDVCPECISVDEQQVRNMEPYVSPLSGNIYQGPPEPHPISCRCGELYIEAVA